MKTRAAILWGVGQEWSVEEVELDPPKEGEVLVEMKAAALCHSDEHMVTGDMVVSVCCKTVLSPASSILTV